MSAWRVERRRRRSFVDRYGKMDAVRDPQGVTMNQIPMAAETAAVREAFAALNRNDIRGFVRILDPQIERTEPAGLPGSGTYRGLDALTTHLVTSREKWAEGSCELERILTAGDRVIALVHVRVRLAHETEWREGRIADGFTFRNRKAVQWITFLDQREALMWGGIKTSDVG